MTNVEDSICRLCLSKMEIDYEEIDEEKTKSLSSLLLELDISITESPVACKRCARDLEHACHFKSTCLQTEEIIIAFVALSDGNMLDLREIYLSENSINDLQGGENCICRFCLTCVKKESVLALNVLKDNMIIVREMLEKCLPELDFTLTFDPVVCTGCIKSTERYFTFSKICLEVEQKLAEYCRGLAMVEGKINLNDLVQSIAKNLMGNSVSKYACLSLGRDKEKLDPKSDKNEPSRKKRATIAKNPIHVRSNSHNDTTRNSDLSAYETTTENHMQALTDTPSDPTEHKCRLCPFTAKRKNHLAVHTLSHDPKRIYKCDLCTYETRRKNLLVAHTKTHKHTKEELFKCVLCPYEAEVEAVFKRHMKSHSKVAVNPNIVAQDLMIIKEGGKLRLVCKEGNV